MLRKPLFTLFAALVLAALFCYGVTRLFVLRYEKGDVYPPYSTLRADPLGAKGIYEALSQLPEVEVSRNFRALPKLRPAAPITLVYPGVSHRADWEDRELRVFNGLVLDGTRAVFTFAPVETSPLAAEEKRAQEQERIKKKKAPDKRRSAREKREDKERESEAKPADAREDPVEKQDGKKDDDQEEADGVPPISFSDVASRWGFAFDYLPASKDKNYHRRAVLVDPKAKLEPEISWHTSLFFKDLKPQWKVLYESDGKPVIIERRFGSGSLMLAADSFLLSNEALRHERHPKLLARLFDGPPTLVFDEEHHGVRDDPGIASLARKYRLHGVVAGILLLAVLFVWKNAVRFIPAYAEESADGEIVSGKETAEGFVNLLRRTIKPSEILALCVAEWRKSSAHRPAEQARVEEAFASEEARLAKQRNPINTYREIAQTLTRR